MRSLFLMLVGWLSLCGAAWADGPTDCKGAAFQKALKLKPGFSFDCVEIMKAASPVDGGQWTIRALRHAATDGGQVQPFVDLGIEIVTKAFQAWEPYSNELGFKFGNVSIVFVDPNESEIEFVSQVHGLGEYEAAAHTDGFTVPNDCVISVNVPYLDVKHPELLDLTFAHELFHCIQHWSYFSAAGAGPTAAWWEEGSANLFASMVVSDAAFFQGLGGKFLASIHEKPLTQQSYYSIVFFAWLWQQGPTTMGSFFKGLATQPGEAAQMAATETALGPDLLDAFAQVLVDGTIALPQGFEFDALVPVKANKHLFSMDGQWEAGKIPFTVDAHEVSFMAGSFAVADPVRYDVRKSDSPVWGEMPMMIEPVNCQEEQIYYATRFVTSQLKDSYGLPVIATRYAECHVCQALTELDQCLVGKWKLRNDSLLAYLKLAAADMKDVRYSSVAGTVMLEVTADGKAQWITEGLEIGAQIPVKEFASEVEVEVEMDGIVSGRWTTAASEMHFCAESIDAKYTSKVRMPGIAEDVVTETLPMQDSYLTYQCSGTTLTAIFTGPGTISGPSPSWTMDRIK
jgi:hypothetical protein